MRTYNGYFVKGLNISISLIVVLLMGIAIIVILGSILTGNISGLEDFAVGNIDLDMGGGA